MYVKSTFSKDFFTYGVSQRQSFLILHVTKYDIDCHHYCQHPIKVSNSHPCAKHPRIVSKHPGPKYN